MESQYYQNKESVEEYIQLAKDASGKNLIEQLRQILPEGSEVLEIGSGPGTDYAILSETYQVVGSDYSAVFLGHLKAEYPQGQFLQLNAITLEIERTFDGIYSNKVFQHLADEELASSVQRQAAILRPGGIVCHSFWKGTGSEFFKNMLVNYQDEVTLRNVFAEGFEVLSIELYKEFEEGDSILLIARKK